MYLQFWKLSVESRATKSLKYLKKRDSPTLVFKLLDIKFSIAATIHYVYTTCKATTTYTSNIHTHEST